MTHLTPGTCGPFAVKMKSNAGLPKNALEARCTTSPQITKKVHDGRGAYHAGVAERLIAYCAHELLELAGRAGNLRLVKRVMRTRSELVHEQPLIAGDEHLHGEQPFDGELRCDAARDLRRFG